MLEEPYFHSWRQTNAHGSDIRTRILWRCKLLHVHTGSGDSCRRLMQKKKGKKAKRSNKKGNLIRNSSLSNFSVWSGHKGLFLRNVLVPNSAFLFTFLSQTVAIWDECFTMCHSERNKFFHYCLVRVQLLANVIKTPYDLHTISCRFVGKFSWLYLQKINIREWGKLKKLKSAI